jgi:hypothetical protein
MPPPLVRTSASAFEATVPLATTGPVRLILPDGAVRKTLPPAALAVKVSEPLFDEIVEEFPDESVTAREFVVVLAAVRVEAFTVTGAPVVPMLPPVAVSEITGEFMAVVLMLFAIILPFAASEKFGVLMLFAVRLPVDRLVAITAPDVALRVMPPPTVTLPLADRFEALTATGAPVVPILPPVAVSEKIGVLMAVV